MVSRELSMLIAFGELARRVVSTSPKGQMAVPYETLQAAMSEVESMLSMVRQIRDVVEAIPLDTAMSRSIKDKLTEVLDGDL